MLREVRRAVVGFGGLAFIVEAAGCGSRASRTRAAQAIGLLGTARRARHVLVDSGAVDALVGLMRDGDGPGRIVAGNALGIVSSHVDHLRLVARAGAVPLYVELLQGSEPLGKEIAEDVFCVLAVAEENAVSIMEHLVGVLSVDGGEEAKGAALDVVWDIAMYKHSVPVVRNSGAIPVLIGLMRHGSSDDLREKALRAISQLSYEEENREAMEEEGAIRLLIDLVNGDSDDLREYAAEALICFAEEPRYRERVSEIFEIPSFLAIQERLSRINAAGERMSSSMGLLTVEGLASDLDFGI
ncbi:U-box domain-containing protein 2 [Iris pallida]|uniref:U-box domain-containing protein 2 n=1 Tax=Iris pallida TaxID=29817 RepID=A0AAX6H724_IRIPA|nr:U-box domain-containing protein 2 [Iris pallida]